MAIQRKKGNKQRTGGRRANYAPAASEDEWKSKYRPIGWVNWLGFVLFSLVGIALLAETINAFREERGGDPIAAGAMTVVFGVMVYLFATTRMKD